jgi:hypothetical protein
MICASQLNLFLAPHQRLSTDTIPVRITIRLSSTIDNRYAAVGVQVCGAVLVTVAIYPVGTIKGNTASSVEWLFMK